MSIKPAQGIAPSYSKKRVTRAGDAIRAKKATPEDLKVVENWRASHAHVINTFQANLRRRTRGTEYLVGQRLKRRTTILDKLDREPGMNLSRMHDIAGCRVVFPNIDELVLFRESFLKSRSQHVLLTAERDQFNYIENPKKSGYRGVHDVYRYKSYAKSAEQWSGLLIEVQYRTRAQHAWATAVEIADLLTKSRGKFSDADNNYIEFFRVCSEIIARTIEKDTSCLPKLSDRELVVKFEACVKQQNLLEILERTNSVGVGETKGILKKGLNTILVYPFDPDNVDFSLGFDTFRSTRQALERYEELEKKWENKADVVLVRAQDTDVLMKVFQNYFSDSRDFVKYVKRGIRILSK